MGGYRSVDREDLSELVGFTGTFTLDLGFPAVNGGGLKAKPGTGMRGDNEPGDSRSGLGRAPPLLYAISRRRAAGCYSARPARRWVPCHGLRWPRLRPLVCKSATKAPDATLVLMAAAAALAAADPPPAMPPAAGAGGSAARRDFYWLRSFLAGGIAGCCAKTTVAPLDRVKVLLQAHNHHYKHLGVFSTLRAVPQKEGYLGLYKGNGAMMIRIFPYGAIQFMAFEHYRTFITTKLGISGHVHRLMAGSMAGMTAVICTYPLDMVRVRLAFQVKGEHTYTGIIHAFKTIYAKEGGFLGFYRGLMPTILGMAPYAGVSFFTFGTLKSVGLSHAPTLLGRPSSDNPNVLVLKTHINLLCGGVAGAIAQTISYPFDVTRRRMQLGTVLPEFEKCLTVFQYHAGDSEIRVWTPWNSKRIISWFISELHSLHSLSSSGFHNV
ncbi:solute carrier family 25 member 16 isoform 3-T3 [Hipposideros larvatus]